ncbi:GNAT family N-acetyltransferase [Permianibacter sp. IMCC34836]|uniref:GNAT family N-acetyltransferase n=1 Tax=Permianibacter fluminis TaxID=2738515 RepID=UPI001555D9B8|nr:GNAT family N-acetyltransferase [Permianibacter fluminis]NQD38161.1 GNAT family N-acetyltransferase [Permianibacter fluminis]
MVTNDIPYQEFRIAPADAARGPALQSLIVMVLSEYGLQADLTGVDADVLDIERHYRQPGGDFFAVQRAGTLVGTMGFVPIDADTCELRKMYLLAAARGCGLGRRLLTLAETEVRQRGYRFMQLETASVLKEAVALYERHGYLSQCGAPHVSRCDRRYRKDLSLAAS